MISKKYSLLLQITLFVIFGFITFFLGRMLPRSQQIAVNDDTRYTMHQIYGMEFNPDVDVFIKCIEDVIKEDANSVEMVMVSGAILDVSPYVIEHTSLESDYLQLLELLKKYEKWIVWGEHKLRANALIERMEK